MFSPPDDGLHLFGVNVADDRCMWLVQDLATGNYRMPEFGQSTKESVRKQYTQWFPGGEELFNTAWPMTWAVGNLGVSIVVASLDSGVLIDHPALRDVIIDTLDYTGEGVEDQNGHGTVCAILSRMSPFNVLLISMKVATSDGSGKREFLLNALRDLPKLKERVEIPPQEAHIRCGIYTSRYGGLFDCDGYCDICKAAEEAANAGIALQVAIGNEPNRVACPATAGVIRGVRGIGVLNDEAATVFPGEII